MKCQDVTEDDIIILKYELVCDALIEAEAKLRRTEALNADLLEACKNYMELLRRIEMNGANALTWKAADKIGEKVPCE